MRRGFMNMFPDSSLGIGTANKSIIVDANVKKTQDNDSKNENTTQKLSIFSTLDSKSHGGNENAKIERNEANNASIFNINGEANYQKSVADQGIQSNIIKDENKLKNIKANFDVQNQFNTFLDKAFNKAKSSLSNIEKKVTVKTSERDAAIQQGRSELDSRVTNTLNNINATANANLMSAYQDALMKALADAENKEIQEQQQKEGADGNKTKPDAVEAGKDNTNIDKMDDVKADDLSGKYGNEDGVKHTKTTVYSSYDKNENKHAEFSEMKDKLKYNDRITIMTDNAEAKAAGEAIKKTGQDKFLESLGSFNASIGSKSLKKEDAADKTKIAQYMTELNRKAEDKAQKAMRKANDEVYQSLQREVNQTVTNTLNGIKPETPQPEAPKQNATQAGSTPTKPAAAAKIVAQRQTPRKPGNAGSSSSLLSGGSSQGFNWFNDATGLTNIFGTGSSGTGATSSIGTGSSDTGATSSTGTGADTGITGHKPDWSSCKTADDVVNKVISNLGINKTTYKNGIATFKTQLLNMNRSVFDNTTGKIISGRADNIVLPETKKYFGV